MEHVRNLIETLSPRLEQMVKTETVVGDPIQVQGKTLIPLIRVTYGMFGGGAIGHGEGQGKGNAGEGEGRGEAKGGGTGGGMKLAPVAIVCIDDTGVNVFPIADKKGLADTIAEAIPAIMAKAHAKHEHKGKDDKGGGKHD